jgi:RNA polymerase sigma-54 factor
VFARGRGLLVLLQHEQRQTITQRIDPKLIMANSILQLSSMELTQSIENELLENPALVILEDISCSGDCVDPVLCPFCAARRASDFESDQQLDTLDMGDQDAERDSIVGNPFREQEDDYDLVGNLEAEITLQEHLRGLLRAAVPAEDYVIGEYLINCLNERGWLAEKPENIAIEMDVPAS